MDAGRKINELKVAELRSELEKRQCDKNGIKSILLEKLKKALIQEGQDPDNVIFLDNGDCLEETFDDEDEKMEVSDMSFKLEPLESSSLKPSESSTSLASMNDVPPATKGTSLTLDDMMKIKGSIVKSDDNVSMIVHVGDNENELEKTNTKTDAAGDKRDAADLSSDAKAKVSDNSKTPVEDSSQNDTDSANNDAGKNIWVTNISTTIKAVDLKQLFGEHGKVLTAKIVMNAKSEPPKRFGYLQLASLEDVENCIAKLNGTEVDGCVISIRRAKSQPNTTKDSNKDTPFKKVEGVQGRNYRNGKPGDPGFKKRSYTEILASRRGTLRGRGTYRGRGIIRGSRRPYGVSRMSRDDFQPRSSYPVDRERNFGPSRPYRGRIRRGGSYMSERNDMDYMRDEFNAMRREREELKRERFQLHEERLRRESYMVQSPSRRPLLKRPAPGPPSMPPPRMKTFRPTYADVPDRRPLPPSPHNVRNNYREDNRKRPFDKFEYVPRGAMRGSSHYSRGPVGHSFGESSRTNYQRDDRPPPQRRYYEEKSFDSPRYPDKVASSSWSKPYQRPPTNPYNQRDNRGPPRFNSYNQRPNY